MPSDSGRTTSVWMGSAKLPSMRRLEQNEAADVCVVGAGIAGLSTAYHLAREGRSVVVIDDGAIASGETGRTTAHLVTALDDRYYALESLHGEKGARLAAESHTAAITTIEEIVRREKIDCEFERVDGYLFAQEGHDPDELSKELEAAHRAGLVDVELVPRAPIPDFDTGAALRFPMQAQFHPLKYLAGIAGVLERAGARLYGGVHAGEITGESPLHVKTAGGYSIEADDVVVATNTPVNDRFKIHTKQAAYRTFVVGLEVSAGSIPKALFWDTGNPYHYVRLVTEREKTILIVGGEDHKTGQEDDAEERFDRLVTWTRERFRSAGRVSFRWSGQVMEPVDGLAFIGRNPGDKHIYICTGDSGNGMTHCTIAGLLLTDLIVGRSDGRSNDWADLYDPSRKSLKALKDFVKENANVAAQYKDLVTGGEVQSVAEIASGSGAVIRRGLKKIAVYRDEGGELHELSAICTHLGCVVDWNTAEKTWDCPCHGSRFSACGEVVNGPAVTPLQPCNEQEDQVEPAALTVADR